MAKRTGASVWAHPRVCGENWSQLIEYGLSAGSSPRVRGKRRPAERFRLRAGLIPACAGKTYCTAPPTSVATAHPRVCGENRPGRVHVDDLGGSSPRVRGKQRRAGLDRLHARLIPACAGKTPSHWGTRMRVTAHPRVCGENIPTSLRVVIRPGSSPRVRGKLQGVAAPARRAGLIPACAGKTVRRSLCRSWTTAHPRVCGENDDTGGETRAVPGSSPRVRGKRPWTTRHAA